VRIASEKKKTERKKEEGDDVIHKKNHLRVRLESKIRLGSLSVTTLRESASKKGILQIERLNGPRRKGCHTHLGGRLSQRRAIGEIFLASEERRR